MAKNIAQMKNMITCSSPQKQFFAWYELWLEPAWAVLKTTKAPVPMLFYDSRERDWGQDTDLVASTLKCKGITLMNMYTQSSEWGKSQSTYTNARQHACPVAGPDGTFHLNILHINSWCTWAQWPVSWHYKLSNANVSLSTVLVKQIEETHTSFGWRPGCSSVGALRPDWVLPVMNTLTASLADNISRPTTHDTSPYNIAIKLKLRWALSTVSHT